MTHWTWNFVSTHLINIFFVEDVMITITILITKFGSLNTQHSTMIKSLTTSTYTKKKVEPEIGNESSSSSAHKNEKNNSYWTIWWRRLHEFVVQSTTFKWKETVLKCADKMPVEVKKTRVCWVQCTLKHFIFFIINENVM